MSLEVQQITLAILGGLLAGGINTLAGNGSVITLTMLTELFGLPPNVANGTNRVGIVFQTFTSSVAFYKNGRIDLWKSRELLFFIFFGAMLGVYVAINISNEQFLSVFKYLLIVMFVVILVNPKRWLHKSNGVAALSPIIRIPIYLILGFYGGFIQMGMGIVFLIVTVLILKYELINANALKSVVIFLYTIVVLLIFQWKGLVHWEYGLIIAIGQSIGGYLTAKYASESKSASLVAYVLLVVMVFVAIVRLFFF